MRGRFTVRDSQLGWSVGVRPKLMSTTTRSAKRLRLTDLAIGEEARVGEYPEMTEYSERLIRMGLIPGTTITLERVAPLGDPVEIRFRGYALVLRPSEAHCLNLERT